jgi:hypothetical protein
MNNIDIENIKKELAKRKAANYEWKDGGEMTKDDIMLRTTKELNELITTFNDDSKKIISEQIKKQVDKIFEKWGKKGDNMILLTCVKRSDYHLRNVDEYDYILTAANWEWEKYNKLCYPVMGHKDTDIKSEDYEEFENEVYNLYDLLDKSNYKWEATSLFKTNNDGINEYWCGFSAITKNYKIVSFIMRYDGMLMDEEKYESVEQI